MKIRVVCLAAAVIALASPVMAAPASPSADVMDKKTATTSPAIGRVSFGKGKVTAKTAETLTVEKDNKSYAIQTDSNTRLRFKYGGKASLTDVLVNDEVFIVGRWVDASRTTAKALVIRDLSVGRHVFIGEVLALTDDGWTMDPVFHDNLTVNVTSATKLVNRREQKITKADVKVGDRVRVKGLFRKFEDTVNALHVKNYELPP